MRSIIRRHPIAAFLIAFYGLGWAVFLPALLGTEGFGIIDADIPVGPFRLLSIVFFALIPFALTALLDGRGAAGRLIGRVRHVRVGVRWYAVALFAAPAVLFVATLALKGGTAIDALVAGAGSIPGAYLLPVVLLAALGNVWEETSWSGFVTERLQRRFGPLRASLITAPLFGLYHLPLFFVVAGLDDGPSRLPMDQLPLYVAFLFVGLSVPMRLLITWMYNSSDRSVALAGLFHASINVTASAAILTGIFAGVDGFVLYAALGVLALVVVVGTRGRLGVGGRETGAEGGVARPLALDATTAATGGAGVA